MAEPRRKPPYWRRSLPRKKYDIKRLRPEILPRRERFETQEDVKKESRRSQSVLDGRQDGGGLGDYLEDCRQGHYHCERSYCPICARIFRRYFIGELLRHNAKFEGEVAVVVVLLETAAKGKLSGLDIESHRHALRKRLDRAGLEGAPVIGGFEIAYRAAQRVWVLHANLVVFGAPKRALDDLEAGSKAQDAFRPVKRSQLENPAKQLSYVLKFTTYHRPWHQTGPRKPAAVPLNPTEHCELVRWMHRYGFSDYVFLYNARRHGSTIALLTQSDGNA